MQKKLFKYTFEILLKIRFEFTILKYRLLILFSQKKFKFDDITKINSPLILISQIQRSGGTLLAQLFDGSDQVYAYPTELQVTRPKWALEKEKNFNILHQEYFHRIAKTKRFSKPGKATWAISTERSLKSSKGNNRVLIINFEELIINTKKTMNHLCSYLNIDQEEIFYHPTFNKEKVLSDSSFKANKGVDKNVLDRTKYLDKALLNKLQVNHCEDLYAESLIESINISSS